MNQPIPSEFRELGPLRAEFPMGAGLGKAKFRAGLYLLGAVVLIVGGLFFKHIPGPVNPKPEGQRIVQISLIIAGVVLVGCALLLFLLAYLNRNGRVLIFADGLLCVWRNKPRLCRWKDVEELWEFKGRAHGLGFIHYCRLVLADGQKLVVNDQDLKDEHLESLRALVREEVAKELWPRVQAACSLGQTFWFGKIGINPHGLEWAGGHLAWDQVSGLEFDDDGWIRAHTRGTWEKLPVHFEDVPNSALLVRAVKKITGELPEDDAARKSP